MIALVALALVVTLVVLAIQRSQRSASGPKETTSPRAPRPARSLAQDLDRWVAADLLAADQAEAILAHEQGRPVPVPARAAAPRPSGRVPVVAEALGYLGGVLALVGLVLVLAHYWPDLATPGRLALSGVAAVALVGGGFAVRPHDDAALTRLRWFLWLLSSAATAVFVGVLVTGDVERDPQTVLFWCSAAVAVQSGLLWWWRNRPVQQITALGGLAVATGSGIALVLGETPAGIGLWVLGVGYLALGLTRRTPAPVLTEFAAAVTLLAGGVVMISGSMGVGLLVVVATSVGLLGVVTTPRLDLQLIDRLALGLPAAVVALQIVPSTLAYFAQGAGVATGLVTWAFGATLVVVASKAMTRQPVPTELVGGLALLGGAALTGVDWDVGAPLLGLATSIALVALGMRPGRVVLSMIGALGLLINVPWAVGELFPGEGRAPLLIMVSGAVLVGVSVWMARQGDRFRHDFGARDHRVTAH